MTMENTSPRQKELALLSLLIVRLNDPFSYRSLLITRTNKQCGYWIINRHFATVKYVVILTVVCKIIEWNSYYY